MSSVLTGCFPRMARATRGITAGSGFATTELRILLGGMVKVLREKWPTTLHIKLFVDDLTLAACGLPARAIAMVADATNCVIDWLENHLKMAVSCSKSKVSPVCSLWRWQLLT